MKKFKMVPIDQWGHDHKTTLMYLETRCVDHHGTPDKRHMRCDRKRHPEHAHLPPEMDRGRCSPTRLADGRELFNHDDWDCVADFVAAGLVEEIGTGLHPRWRLTPAGWEHAHRLRRERAGRP